MTHEPSAPRPVATSRHEAGQAVTMILVVTVILLVAFVFLWYVSVQDIANYQARIADANQERQEAIDRLDAALDGHQGLSDRVGYRDDVLRAKTNLETLEAAVESARELVGPALGDAGAEPTVEQTINALTAALRAEQQKATTAKADLDGEIQARRAAESRINQIESDYQSRVANLDQQLSDAQARYDSLESDDQRTFSNLQAENDDLDRRVRAAERALAEAQEAARRSTAEADATIKALAMRPLELEPEAPDGVILEVGTGGDLAYIDIGRRDGLRNGTRFEVLRPGKGGALEPRGMVEVRSVEDDMAQVGALGEVDLFDPILPGDVVRNPHFVRREMQHFYLLGDFPVTLSKDFLERRLEELGATVDDSISTQTDVVVLGLKSLTEGEDGPELTETDEYRLANDLGIRTIRLDDLAGFVRY